MGAAQTRRPFASAPPEDSVAMLVAELDGQLVGYALRTTKTACWQRCTADSR